MSSMSRQEGGTPQFNINLSFFLDRKGIKVDFKHIITFAELLLINIASFLYI